MTMFITLLLVKVTFATSGMLFVTFVLRDTRAAVRHLALAAGFVILLILPVAAVLLPTVEVEINRPLSGLQAGVVESNLTLVEQLLPIGPASLAVTPAPPPSVHSIQLLIWLWASGAVFCMLPLTIGLLAIRRVRRKALPWSTGEVLSRSLAHDLNLHRRIDVVLHESMMSPVMFGAIRPIIIFPPDAQTWSDADVRRALLHELEHVRRYDWLVHCFARAVCSLYWFHPLVWICWRQLSLEGERACDDAVLRHDDAPSYAEQLVALAERLARQRHRAALAMATRGDLAARVRSVLKANTSRDGIRATTVVPVVVAATMMAAGSASLQVVSATPAQIISDTGASDVSFEVASVKQNHRGEGLIDINTSPGGRFVATNVPVRTLIRIAYDLEDFQVIDTVRWVNEDRFDVVAKTARELPPMSGPFRGPAELRPMLRSLLVERFGLLARTETREVPILALRRSRRDGTLGSGLTRSSIDCAELTAKHKPDDEPLHCGLRLSPGMVVLEGASIDQLAAALTAITGRKVVDETGVTGSFDLQLSWTPIRPGADVVQGRALVTALQEEAGFTLESTRGSLPVLIVKSIHKPSEN